MRVAGRLGALHNSEIPALRRISKSFSFSLVFLFSFAFSPHLLWAEPATPAAPKRHTLSGIQSAHQVASLEDLIQLWQDAEA